MKSRPWLWAAITAAVWFLVPQASGLAERAQSAAATAPRTSSLPASISDEDFWKLTVDLSEPNGSFQSENLVGNERPMQNVVPTLEALPRGGAYLGVAPDQNFTYILALDPRIAFIVDIRRGNLLEHLMYKAIIELSSDRADFLARLFSRRQPKDLDGVKASVTELFDAYRTVTPSDAYHAENVTALHNHLVNTHRFGLSEEDIVNLDGIYEMFFRYGPQLSYNLSASPRGNMPTYAEMLQLTDREGRMRSYLASDGAFQRLKALQRKNLIVPITGDFAGPKALRAVGDYVRSHDATVTAFYTSNVEQYLFRSGVAPAFYQNVATLPIDDRSVFIRSAAGNNVIDSISGLLKDFSEGRITVYGDITIRGSR